MMFFSKKYISNVSHPHPFPLSHTHSPSLSFNIMHVFMNVFGEIDYIMHVI